ncbi:DUF5683 domain-containing protein [Ferruginibacter paludis]|uniref:DUF5683 domain-containing protein n=1 Tax=Ferruginibacter paludis TaxID=1310417 RepID=UPI0025B5D620|nr:DUF5683 domain-containing protein [Ferruginibacter paludis]MDN3655102.1 DUF5683 domain-containing protein [Ferruginibacter paludis]
MQKILPIFLLLFLSCLCCSLYAQQLKDSAIKKVSPAKAKKDSIAKKEKVYDSTGKEIKVFNPRMATIHSAIIPGWGQIDNKKYWKLPLVYGALGTTAYVFFYNIKTYKLLRLAYIYASDTLPSNDHLIDAQFKNLSANSIKIYRNSFRQNVDYSVLFFIFFWGLNVVDATVDAQLKAFDVNDNLSLKLSPGFSPMANTTGLSLVFDIHSKNHHGSK